MGRKADEYEVRDKANTYKKEAFKQVGVDEATGDKVVKGVTVVGVGLKLLYTFKKTVLMGAAAAAATAVGKVKAPQATDKVLSAGKVAMGSAVAAGSAAYRGLQKGFIFMIDLTCRCGFMTHAHVRCIV